MIKAVWMRLERAKTYRLLALLLAIVIAEIVLTCVIPMWREGFYNILQTKDKSQFHTSLIYFFTLLTGLGLAQGMKVWVGQLVSFQIRIAATKTLFKAWVKGPRRAENYSQAMTESIRNSTELYLEILVEILISASIVIALIMANLHNTLVLSAALIYTAGISVAACLFNAPLISSDMRWQSEEGRLRETISDIANGNEDFSFKEKLLRLSQAYYKYIGVVMGFTLFSRLKGSLASLIPYLLVGGPFFSGEVTLGEFMGAVATFELIVINSTILVLLYPKLTKARASFFLSKQFYGEVS